MTFKHLLFLFPLTALVLFSSCGEDDDDTDPPSTTTYSNPTPTFTDGDGLLAAIQVISYQTVPVLGETAIYADVATAAFDYQNVNNLSDAGTVSVNGFELNKLDGNNYILPGQGSTSVDFEFSSSSTNDWNVQGSADVPAIMHTTAKRMPGDVKFASDYAAVNTSTNVTIEIENAPVNSDSILFVMAYENGTVTKTVGPNTTSATFSSADLSGFTGTGVVQVAAYNYELRAEAGKNYYFINESVVSQVAEFN